MCAICERCLNERPCMSDTNERQQQILDAAAAVIIRLGYDKTTMSDIAEEAGAIRQDIDAAVIVHIVEMLSYGQLTIGDFKPLDQFPPYDAVMEALADIMDRALRPQDAPTGANSEAGKAIIRQITASARAQLEQIKQAREIRSQGANP